MVIARAAAGRSPPESHPALACDEKRRNRPPRRERDPKADLRARPREPLVAIELLAREAGERQRRHAARRRPAYRGQRADRPDARGPRR